MQIIAFMHPKIPEQKGFLKLKIYLSFRYFRKIYLAWKIIPVSFSLEYVFLNFFY